MRTINKPLRKGLRKKFRHYIVGDKEYVSVTTPLAIMSFQQLDLWKQRVGATKAGIIGRKAGNYGNKMHKYFEWVCLGKDFKVRKKYKKDVEAFRKWAASNITEVLDTEKSVYSHKVKLAGRFDLLCRLKGYDGICIVDFKTGRIKAEHFLQLAAYLKLTEESDKKYKGKITNRIVLGIRDGKCKSVVIDKKNPLTDNKIDSDWEVYQSVLKVWRWKNKL